MENKYLIAIGLMLSPGIALLLLISVYFWRTGDLLSLQHIVNLQSEHACLYAGVRGDTLPYKYIAYKTQKPQIVAIGSSRSMQLRQKYFAASFYGVGAGEISDTDVLPSWTAALLQQHKPELAVLILDYWWFHPQTQSAMGEISKRDLQEPNIEPRLFTLPFKWVREGESIDLSLFIQILTGKHPEPGKCRIGTRAMARDVGYAPDGSFYYGEQITKGIPKPIDIQFATNLSSIESGKMVYGSEVDPEAWKQFTEALRQLQEAGVEVLLIQAPLAPTIHKKMQEYSANYGYIQELDTKLTALGIPYINALNGASIGSTDCEFPDGTHGGEITFARILQIAHQRFPQLRPYLQKDLIDSAIERSAGLITDPDTLIGTEQEIDSLQIGCVK